MFALARLEGPLAKGRAVVAVLSIVPALYAVGCEEPARPAPEAPTAAPPSSPPPAARVSLAGPTAFALVTAPFGATLAWGREEAGSKSLWVLDLNESGHSERSAWQLLSLPSTAERVSDLSFAWQEMNRAALWSESNSRETQVVALFKTESGAARRFELGTGFHAPTESRGNAALNATEQGVSALVRGAEEACADPTSAKCYGFRFHRFETDQEPSTRVSLSVPVPCEAHAAQLVHTEERWHYAVCTTDSGRPVQTVFTIQPRPEYASAREMFPDCAPLGTFRAGEQAALVAQCGGARRIAWLGPGDEAVEEESFEPEAPRCAEGVVRLRIGTRFVDLTEPVSHLQTLLPSSLAEPRDQAVWTGRALVVARRSGTELLLSRFVCTGAELAQAEPPSP